MTNDSRDTKPLPGIAAAATAPESRGREVPGGPSCPLCGLGGSLPVAEVPGDALRRLWRSRLEIEVPAEWPPRFTLRECAGCTLRFYDPVCVGAGEFYSRLQRFAWYYLEEKDEYALAARRIGPDHAVLEVGAGRGAFARRIACASYTGLELSEAAAREARERGLDVRVESIEVFVRERAGQFDRVCLFQVLEHVPNPREFLRACADCVGSGGLLIVSVPSEDSFLREETNAVLNLPPHHQTRWTDRALAAALTALGFELLELAPEPLADHHLVNCARARAQTTLRRLLRRDYRLVDPLFAMLPMRAAVAAASLPYERRLRRSRLLTRGHSVTAIGRKP